MPWGEIVDTNAAMSASQYAKQHLGKWFQSRPTDELYDAEDSFRLLYETENNATALGIAEYIRSLILSRERQSSNANDPATLSRATEKVVNFDAPAQKTS
jgi:hypothetical protein